MKITVGGRESPLSLAQVDEVLHEIRQHHPEISFQLIPVKTIGDKDRTTSLRTLGKTDFFTKEIDNMQLNGKCRLSIHSAKDLPEPLREGLTIVALTKGVDSSDSRVLREGESRHTLPSGAVIAPSSVRREETVKSLRSDLTFIDFRGVIGERLAKLETSEADGVVVAEAALIRLKLTHLNRIRLPGTTTPFQGRLAIIARSDDTEMHRLFKAIDCR